MKSNRDLPVRTRVSANGLVHAGIPRSYVNHTIDDFSGDVTKKVATRYIDNIHSMYEDKQDLLLSGENGTGKTMLASIILKHAYFHRYKIAMITMGTLLDITFNQKLIENQVRLNEIKDAQFIVIDELGKETFTATGSNKNLFENFLRTAHQTGQVIIICTNMDVDGIREQYGKSVASLIDGTFGKLFFRDTDKRKTVQKGKKSMQILAGK